jgi:ABC-type protease/lipase transport system fused ATPase/permease subunit
MFPLPILTYIKLGAAAISLLFAAYLGYSFEHSRFLAFKATIAAETATLEKEHQAATDKIRTQKDAQINSINAQLVDAISELRKRPSRAQDPSNGSCGTGATLSAEDAEFLIREAARADEIRIALQSCYRQYDSLK